jgi:hypothetical protein
MIYDPHSCMFPVKGERALVLWRSQIYSSMTGARGLISDLHTWITQVTAEWGFLRPLMSCFMGCVTFCC